MATYMKLRSVCAWLAWVTTKDPLLTAPIYIVPFFHSAAAFAVFGKASTVEPAPQFGALIVVQCGRSLQYFDIRA